MPKSASVSRPKTGGPRTVTQPFVTFRGPPKPGAEVETSFRLSSHDSFKGFFNSKFAKFSSESESLFRSKCLPGRPRTMVCRSKDIGYMPPPKINEVRLQRLKALAPESFSPPRTNGRRED